MTQRHHCFQIQTPDGLQAKIHGDRNMQPETSAALAELIDAVMKSVPRAIATGSDQPIEPFCEICDATNAKTHDPDCPHNPIYDFCEDKMILEEFESL